MSVPDRFEVKAVGVSFRPGYPESVLGLAEAYAQLPAGVPGEASLVREPDNPADANAVGVLAGGMLVGYLPAALAARVGRAEVLINSEFPERPGLLIQVERVRQREGANR